MQKHFGGCKPEEALVSPKSAKSASDTEKKAQPQILENFSRFMKTRANEVETLKALVCGIINDVSLLQLNGQDIDRNIKVFQAYMQMDSITETFQQPSDVTNKVSQSNRASVANI